MVNTLLTEFMTYPQHFYGFSKGIKIITIYTFDIVLPFKVLNGKIGVGGVLVLNRKRIPGFGFQIKDIKSIRNTVNTLFPNQSFIYT